MVGSGDAEEVETGPQRVGVATDEVEACGFALAGADDTVVLVETVEGLGQLIQIRTDVVRHELGGRLLDDFGIFGDFAQERTLARLE